MSQPAAPTLASLVSESLSKAGVDSPSSALTTRATSQWIEEIKADICKISKKLKPLFTTSIGVLTIGQSRYPNPSDYFSDLTLEILDGQAGIAQAGSTSSITLSATEPYTNVQGKEILIQSGTGIGSFSQAVTYDIPSKVASFIPTLTSACAVGSGYLIVTNYTQLNDLPAWDLANQGTLTNLDKPTGYYPVGSPSYGEFILNHAPDKAYGLRRRYYADLKTIDTTGTLMLTLYQRWRNVWLAGLTAKVADNEGFGSVNELKAIYRNELQETIYPDVEGMDLTNLKDRITDYF